MSEELRKLAEAATRGPWFAEPYGDHNDRSWLIADLARWRGESMANAVSFGEDEATATYVAAVSPDVVLGLLNRIDLLRSERDEARRDAAAEHDAREETAKNAEHHAKEAAKWQRQVERTIAERESARERAMRWEEQWNAAEKDAERLYASAEVFYEGGPSGPLIAAAEAHRARVGAAVPLPQAVDGCSGSDMPAKATT